MLDSYDFRHLRYVRLYWKTLGSMLVLADENFVTSCIYFYLFLYGVLLNNCFQTRDGEYIKLVRKIIKKINYLELPPLSW